MIPEVYDGSGMGCQWCRRNHLPPGRGTPRTHPPSPADPVNYRQARRTVCRPPCRFGRRPVVGAGRRPTVSESFLMLTLKLPDGAAKQVPPGTRPRDVAEGIGKRLAQAAIAAKVNGTVLDLDREITPPADAGASPEVAFQILTDKDREALDVLRHSCAHVMARAVLRLFPGAQLAFGPATEHGFYYDIDSPTPVTEADFPRIGATMRQSVN